MIYVALELIVAVAVMGFVYVVGRSHWRTMTPGRVITRIFGWYLMAIGIIAVLFASLDVGVPDRVMAFYAAEIALGYCIKERAGSYWPLPHRRAGGVRTPSGPAV